MTVRSADAAVGVTAAASHVSSGRAAFVVVLGVLLVAGGMGIAGFAAAAVRGDDRWRGMKLWRDSATERGKRISLPILWGVAAVAAVGGGVAIAIGVSHLYGPSSWVRLRRTVPRY